MPIIVPHGQQVGDLFRSDNWLFVARAEDCFPGLSANLRHSSGALPTLSGHGTRGLSAALGVSSIGEASLGSIGEHDWELSFANVQIASASVLQLRAWLRTPEPECAWIKPALEALTEVALGVFDGHPIHARTAHILANAFPRFSKILSVAHFLH